MAINPAVPQRATTSFWNYPAVVDVDIKSALPNDPTTTTGEALGVYILGNLAGGSSVTVADAIRAEDSLSADGDKGIGALAVRKATPANSSGTDGDYEYLQMNNGLLWTAAQISFGTTGLNPGSPDNTDGQAVVSTATLLKVVSREYVHNGTTWDRLRKPNGFSRIASTAATGSPTSAKASAGDASCFWGQNGAAVTYLQLYNKSSAPVIGTDTPVATFPIPASAAFSSPSGFTGTYFSAGLAYAFTTDAAATTAAAAAAVTAFLLTFA